MQGGQQDFEFDGSHITKKKGHFRSKRWPDGQKSRWQEGQKSKWLEVQMARSPDSQQNTYLNDYGFIQYVYTYKKNDVAAATPATPLTSFLKVGIVCPQTILSLDGQSNQS